MGEYYAATVCLRLNHDDNRYDSARYEKRLNRVRRHHKESKLAYSSLDLAQLVGRGPVTAAFEEAVVLLPIAVELEVRLQRVSCNILRVLPHMASTLPC